MTTKGASIARPVAPGKEGADRPAATPAPPPAPLTTIPSGLAIACRIAVASAAAAAASRAVDVAPKFLRRTFFFRTSRVSCVIRASGVVRERVGREILPVAPGPWKFSCRVEERLRDMKVVILAGGFGRISGESVTNPLRASRKIRGRPADMPVALARIAAIG